MPSFATATGRPGKLKSVTGVLPVTAMLHVLLADVPYNHVPSVSGGNVSGGTSWMTSGGSPGRHVGVNPLAASVVADDSSGVRAPQLVVASPPSHTASLIERL